MESYSYLKVSTISQFTADAKDHENSPMAQLAVHILIKELFPLFHLQGMKYFKFHVLKHTETFAAISFPLSRLRLAKKCVYFNLFREGLEEG
jgi:hypothetical protein